MPRKTITVDVDENLLITANREITNLLYDFNDELSSVDDDTDESDIEEQRDAMEHAAKIINKLIWE
ncbi:MULTISPECIES: hypothetical protein [unclassified Staphylococcus]|uniref:hypothetical protein n=1 Tax=unclassified Staphylococcus TaxID=91994 RepID=UPI001AEBF9F3|nr:MULTISPECIES: hypothetical protein [unclassified Staphylococcus]